MAKNTPLTPCKCLMTIETQLLHQHPTHKGKEVISILAPSAWKLSGKRIYILPLEMTVKNQNKSYNINLEMTYCPICGQKYEQVNPDQAPEKEMGK